MALLLISFVAGVLTVLAPCILPLLPVVLGGAAAGERSFARALTIAVALGASIFVFTFALKATTLFITVPAMFWQILSGGLIIIFGIVTLFPGLWDALPFVGALNRGSNAALGRGYMRKDFWGNVLIGAALGPVFSSCSPTYFILLATVLPAHPLEGVLYIFVYVVGLTLSLLVVALVGQRILDALGVASDPYGAFKRTVGALFIAVGIFVLSGLDVPVQQYILAHAGIFDVTQVEQKLLAARNGEATSTPSIQKGVFLSSVEKALRYQKEPELTGIDAYLNTGGEPITLSQYIGKKVVLIDFWTYSCINCLRTLPYLKTWYDKYESDGLVIIGVHTPEFAFEHLQSNVQDAITRLGIKYPVVLDNEYKTWGAFDNEYWPREYLIDIDGYIVHDHAGEGEYDKTEEAIQAALAERAARLGMATTVPTTTVSLPAPDLGAVQSPETYFGSKRNEYLANGTQGAAGVQSFTLPATPQPNALYLGGSWDMQPEYAQAQEAGDIEFYYGANDVYFVASAQTPVTITVYQDGKLVGSAAGADVDPATSSATIGDERLYHLVHNAAPGTHVLQIKVMGGGLRAYTFTFG